MTAVNRNVIAQGIELGADAFQQGFHIAAGQVRAAYAAVEKHVTA